jgi:aspartyl-tRNA(Asn)/glutamyl-tRNA(Gln) amidotransferase subunit A
VDILTGCFAQIDEWEPKVHAWVVLDREGSLRQAQALDEELKAGKDRGPLHGIPIGIKDIIHVEGLPTACGSKRWAETDEVATFDSNVVLRLREAGAVLMGKTITTPYAWIDPPITRNPWNLERTPGGSSSGSAAAVATGMCLGAIGSQTGGSITRPASFCGVAGMKPTRFRVYSGDVTPLAPSLDQVGPIARTVGDLRLLLGEICISGLNRKRVQESGLRNEGSTRLGRLRGFFDRRAEPVVKSAFDEAVRALVAQGAEVIELDDPVDFEQILKDHRRVMAAEAAGVHSDRLDELPDDYPPRIRDLVREGRTLTALEYLQAKDRMYAKRWSLREAFQREKIHALITHATVTTAPDRSTTGDPAFNSPWSYTGNPTVSFPVGLAPDGLPVAIQIIGGYNYDRELLLAAEWCEQAIRTWRQ